MISWKDFLNLRVYRTLRLERDALIKVKQADGTYASVTALELVNAADATQSVEVVTATNVIEAPESGKTFFLNAAAGFLSTLPLPAAGLHFKFVVKLAPTSNGYTIATKNSANIIIGMIEERAGTAGVAATAGDLVTFVANQSIAGDWFEVQSDGTSWFIHGMTNIAAGVTIGST